MKQILSRLFNHEHLSEAEARQLLLDITAGRYPDAQVAALLTAFCMRDITVDELTGFREALMQTRVPIDFAPYRPIDIVGTGGDGKHSFNCSTATSLTLAGMGYRMLKHGNRAVSSTSGAADALEGLGIPMEKDPDAIVDMLRKRNFAFQYAPYFHPAFANVGPVRKQLGMRTLFNMLGPMLNPACPDYLMMGVGDPEQVDLIAATLQKRPFHKVAVFNGAGGYDELTTMGRTRIVLITDGVMDEIIFDPAQYGFVPCEPEDLEVRDKEEATAVLKEILAGRGPRAMRDMVIVNAAFAIYMLEEGKSLEECVAMARKGVEEGAGMRVLS